MATPSPSKTSRTSKPRRPRGLRTAAAREGWAEVLYPGQQLGLRLDVRELPERLIEAIRTWRSWAGLRHWAALQGLFTAVGYGGRVRWTLDGHLDALGCDEPRRRDPAVRAGAAAEVAAFCKLEVAVYHPDGTLRMRGPLLVVIQQWEARQGEAWTLEGLDLILHPILYEGIRQADGMLRRLWAPAPVGLARIDPARHPHALLLGLVLPIRGRWDDPAAPPLALTGAQLLAAAGLAANPHAGPGEGRVWAALDRTLAALQRAGGVGAVAWDPGAENTPGGLCRLSPPVPVSLGAGTAPAALAEAPRVTTGAALAAWRAAQNWSQDDAAHALGINPDTLRSAEAAPTEALAPELQALLDRAW